MIQLIPERELEVVVHNNSLLLNRIQELEKEVTRLHSENFELTTKLFRTLHPDFLKPIYKRVIKRLLGL